MKQLFSAALAILFFVHASAQTDSSTPHSSKPLLEKGHMVRLVLARDVGSSVAQEGNTVYFEVDTAINLSGTTGIPKGTKAYGTITAVRQHQAMGRKGMFEFSIDRLVLENGRVIGLTSDYTASGRSRAEQRRQ